MILRDLQSVTDSEHCIKAKTWTSRRLLLRADGMGFSMHDTLIHAGTETPIWYKNHLEAVYCVEGEGELHSLDTGENFVIKPGTLYALDKHDRHILRAHTQLRLVCVFNPALSGKETHDTDGSYPLVDMETEKA